MKKILAREQRKIDAVFAHNDDMAIGAIKALEEAGLKPGKNIMIVSIDAAHGAFMAMIEGKLNCSVECNPLLGPQLMKAIQDYENGKDLPLRMITAEGVFPAETARRDLVSRRVLTPPPSFNRTCSFLHAGISSCLIRKVPKKTV